MAEQVSRDPALIFFLACILMFVAGLAVMRVHNRWTGGWPLLGTIFGWFAVLGGLARIVFRLGSPHWRPD
jgi:hypothetical protein